MSQWGPPGGCHGYQGTGVGPQAWVPQAPSPAPGLPTPGFGSANKMADCWNKNPLIYLGFFFKIAILLNYIFMAGKCGSCCTIVKCAPSHLTVHLKMGCVFDHN